MGLLQLLFGQHDDEGGETVKPAREEFPVQAKPDGPVDHLREEFRQTQETHAFWKDQLERSNALDYHDHAVTSINVQAENEARNRRDDAHMRLSLNTRAIADADGIVRVWCGHPDCYGMFYPHEH